MSLGSGAAEGDTNAADTSPALGEADLMGRETPGEGESEGSTSTYVMSGALS